MACDYGSNTGALQIAFERYKEATIQRGFLTSSFASDLEKPPGKFTYEPVSGDLGDQAIFVTHRISYRIGELVIFERLAIALPGSVDRG